MLFFVFIAVLRIITSYLYCINYEEECREIDFYISWIGVYQLVTVDIGSAVSFFVFYWVHLRMQVFKKFLKNNDCEVTECIQIYKSIVDAVELIKKPFDMLYTAALAVSAPNIIMIAYMGLSNPKEVTSSGEVSNYTMEYIMRTSYCIQDLGLVFAPAISAGLLASGANELRLVLQDKLLKERCEERATLTEVFIEYVNARPLRLTLFTVIPLDFSLPLIFINFCITYQIVVAQLSNSF